MCSWWNAAVWSKLLGNLLTNSELDQCLFSYDFCTSTRAWYTSNWFSFSVPSITDLATTGLRRSPRIAAKESDKNHSVLLCNTIMKCFCVFGVAMASLWTPGESSLYCRTQKLVFASVNVFHLDNQNFDRTLNDLHPMALLTEKEHNY